MSAHVVLADIDDGVASVWATLFHRPADEADWLCDQIEQFEMSEKNVHSVIEHRPRNRREAAFRTIILNRTNRAGVMADGAGRLKRGEDGRGLYSRWYPQTLVGRIRQLQRLRGRVEFRREDAFSVIGRFLDRKGASFFVDPPYTAGGQAPGRRLYRHNEVDHRRLLELVKRAAGPAMLTYADTNEIRALAAEVGFEIVEASMRTAHHKQKKELLLTKA